MKTVLYDRHLSLGAKMVEFSGWEMPLQYQGIIAEHNNVRERVGIFDVSHMGRILILGKDAEKFLDFICTNRITGKKNLSATYTVLTMDNGGCVDDVLIYKNEIDDFFLICNAGNRQKVLKHLNDQKKTFDIRIEDRFSEDGILSIQGPLSESVIQQLFPECSVIKPMHFTVTKFLKKDIVLSATGYTGERGFEIYASNAMIPELWDRLLLIGKSFGMMPIGLGARDTLRLEKGYALYGHEISETIAPTESVAAWAVKLDKEKFLGKNALQLLEKSKNKRTEYGVTLIEPGIARADYEVVKQGKKIGVVTSGTHSPTMNQAIAIILVSDKLNIGDIIEIQVRSKLVKAKVVELPFVKNYH